MYLSAIGALTLGQLIVLVLGATATGAGPALALVLAVVAVPLVVRLAQEFVHAGTLISVAPPLPVPAVELAATAPAGPPATCVVYPMILNDPSDIEVLAGTVRRNLHGDGRDGVIAHVALVDLPDAHSEVVEGDSALRLETERRLAALTCESGGIPVAALFRRRLWNGRDGKWMGWERKRGKLMEFCELAGGSDRTSFQIDNAGTARLVRLLRSARFAITLDAGSRLTEGSARRLIGAMAHHQNRPVLDHRCGKVVSGFTFLRPEFFCPAPPTYLSYLLGGPAGSAEGPPIGQLVAGHDVFYGQGIFDIEAARTALRERIDENTVLSHDKLEGALAGAARVSGARVVDEGPADYLSLRTRQHRWARGDFHALPWIFGRRRLAINRLNRWLLLADLLEQLMPVSLLGLLALTWAFAPPPAVGAWTVAVAAAYLADLCLASPIVTLFGRHGGESGRGVAAALERVRAAVLAMGPGLLRKILHLALIADQAAVAVDAMVRSGYRAARRRNVLEWVPASKTQRRLRDRPPNYWRTMWAAPALAVLIGAIVALLNPPALPWSVPLLVLWLLSPHLASQLQRERPDPGVG